MSPARQRIEPDIDSGPTTQKASSLFVWVRTGIRNEGIRFLEASARKESRMDEEREGVPGSLLGV